MTSFPKQCIHQRPVKCVYRIDLLLEDPLLFLQRDEVIMLDRDYDGVNSLGDHSSVLLVIMYRHLWDSQEIKKLAHNNVYSSIITDLIYSSLSFTLIYLVSCCCSEPNFPTG